MHRLYDAPKGEKVTIIAVLNYSFEVNQKTTNASGDQINWAIGINLEINRDRTCQSS